MTKIEEPSFRELVSGPKSRIGLWAHVLTATGVKTMLEVGVWKGDFAAEILRRCQSIERYYMLDPWARLPDWNKPFNVSSEAFDEVYEEAMRRTGFASSRIVVLRGRTKEVADDIPDGSLDFAYVDGDHTLRGITIDLVKLLPKIKEGGLIGGDDFSPNPWQHDLRFEPTLVCPFAVYFAEAMELPILALPFNQFLIQKRSQATFSFTDLTGRYTDISLNRRPPGPIRSAIKRTVRGLLSKVRAFRAP